MKITISDIAKLANVSKATVSRVINNKTEGVGKETREKILNIMQECNYQPSLLAQSLVTKKTKSIGLIIPDIMNPFFPQVVRGAEDYANKHGYHIFLCNSDKSIEKEKEYIKNFVEKSVDGVILASNMSKDESKNTSDAYNLLKQRNIACVLLDRFIENNNYTAGVYLDNIKGAYMATDFLLNHNHKEIAFITGPLAVETSANRLKGYEMALNNRGVSLNTELVMQGDYIVNSGYNHTMKLLEHGKKFTAIFAANDLMAIGAIKALRCKNIKIPDEVEVIGFDNIEISQLVEPALSTIAQPMYEMGRIGARLLIKLIGSLELKSKSIMLEPELILRGTTRR